MVIYMTYSKIRAHLEVAKIYASLSKARRLKVGALIVKDDRPISVGFNGTPSGADNNCEDEINGELVTKPNVIHAELNALYFAAKNGISTKNCTLIITDSTCMNCALGIIQAGITSVYYGKEFRDTTGLELLRENNIKVEQVGV